MLSGSPRSQPSTSLFLITRLVASRHILSRQSSFENAQWPNIRINVTVRHTVLQAARGSVERPCLVLGRQLRDVRTNCFTSPFHTLPILFNTTINSSGVTNVHLYIVSAILEGSLDSKWACISIICDKLSASVCVGGLFCCALLQRALISASGLSEAGLLAASLTM